MGDKNSKSKASEIVRLISNAESDAESRHRIAEENAKKIIADAGMEADQYEKLKDAEITEKIEKIKKVTAEKSNELSAKINEQTVEECEKLKSDAREHKGTAVSAAVERVIREWRL